MKKNIILILALSMFACSIDNKQRTMQSSDQQESVTIAQQPLMQIDTTLNLYVFKPNFSRVEFEVGTMPSVDGTEVIFCAAAAYTDKPQYGSGVVGNYITYGELRCDNPSKADGDSEHYGRFVYTNGKWYFVECNNEAAVDYAVYAKGCMFTQMWAIKDGNIYLPYARDSNRSEIYRAICEKDGELMIAQSRKAMPYLTFVQALKAYGMKNALYMDMGTGWNHSFYRDNKDKAHTLFPRAHNYCTNWITFYK